MLLMRGFVLCARGSGQHDACVAGCGSLVQFASRIQARGPKPLSISPIMFRVFCDLKSGALLRVMQERKIQDAVSLLIKHNADLTKAKVFRHFAMPPLGAPVATSASCNRFALLTVGVRAERRECAFRGDGEQALRCDPVHCQRRYVGFATFPIRVLPSVCRVLWRCLAIRWRVAVLCCLCWLPPLPAVCLRVAGVAVSNRVLTSSFAFVCGVAAAQASTSTPRTRTRTA